VWGSLHCGQHQDGVFFAVIEHQENYLLVPEEKNCNLYIHSIFAKLLKFWIFNELIFTINDKSGEKDF